MPRNSSRRDVLRSVGVGALGGGLASTGAVGGARPVGGPAGNDAAVSISTVEELQAIEDDLSGDYVLAEDVDASGFDFEPLGGPDRPFTGTFSGSGKRIAGLTVDADSSGYVGLFGVVESRGDGSGGTVENIFLDGADVVGGSDVGSLVGVNAGHVGRITADGSVDGERRVGGLVGTNAGCVVDARTVTHVTATTAAGGVAGRNDGYVTESYSTGDVAAESEVGGVAGAVSGGAVTRSTGGSEVTGTGRNAVDVGGLVGSLGGRVSSSTAEGAVSADENVGALVGYSNGGSVVLASTATGSVNGTADGPLVGTDDGEVVTADHPSLGGHDRTAWWHHAYTADRVSASPTVVNGAVYAGTAHGVGGCEPRAYALDAATGDRNWSLDTEARGTRTAGRHRRLSYVQGSSANVVDGTAYMKLPARGVVLAVDADSGEVTWRRKLAVEGHPGSPSRYGDHVFAQDGEWLYWLDPASGETVHRRRLAGVCAAATVGNGRVYGFDRNDGLRAFSAVTADPLWTYGEMERPTRHTAPTVAAGNAYVGARNGEFHAVEAAAGDRKWAVEVRANGNPDPAYSTPTVALGTVFFGARSGNVYALDAGTGEETWRHTTQTASPVYSSPTVVDDTVFVGADDGHLYALDVETGDEKWSFETRGVVRSSPTVVDGTVYVGSSNGFVYAIEADVDGSSRGSRVTLGTLGHHEGWTRLQDVPEVRPVQETASPTTGGPGATGTATGTGPGQQGTGGTGTTVPATTGTGDGGTSGGNTTGSGGSPGPGILGALGSLLGGVYLLRRRAARGSSGESGDE